MGGLKSLLDRAATEYVFLIHPLGDSPLPNVPSLDQSVNLTLSQEPMPMTPEHSLGMALDLFGEKFCLRDVVSKYASAANLSRADSRPVYNHESAP